MHTTIFGEYCQEPLIFSSPPGGPARDLRTSPERVVSSSAMPDRCTAPAATGGLRNREVLPESDWAALRGSRKDGPRCEAKLKKGRQDFRFTTETALPPIFVAEKGS